MQTKILVALLVGVLAISGCRTAPLSNVVDASYGAAGTASPAALSLTDIEKAIIRAGSKRKWVFTSIAPGHLEATVNVRGKHRATVDILFNRDQFSILHKSSSNLNYDASNNTIHPNYNSWVQLLETDIRAEIQAVRAS